MGVKRLFAMVVKQFPDTLVKGPYHAKTLMVDFNSLVHKAAGQTQALLRDYVDRVLRDGVGAVADDPVTHTIGAINHGANPFLDARAEHWADDTTVSEDITRVVRQYVAHLSVAAVGHILESYKLQGLQNLYIFIDGMPTVAKMIEQRRRRTMTRLERYGAQLILEHYAETMDEAARWRYQKLEPLLQFDKSQITSNTAFMRDLVALLRDPGTTALWKESSRVPELHIHIDPDTRPGEAEHKLTQVLDLAIAAQARASKAQAARMSVAVYSPDADLMLLLLERIGHMGSCLLLRPTDSPALREVHGEWLALDIARLYGAMTRTAAPAGSRPRMKLHYSPDIAFINLLFGCDFLPALEEVDVSKQYHQVIYVYQGLRRPLIADGRLHWAHVAEFLMRLGAPGALHRDKEGAAPLLPAADAGSRRPASAPAPAAFEGPEEEKGYSLTGFLKKFFAGGGSRSRPSKVPDTYEAHLQEWMTFSGRYQPRELDTLRPEAYYTMYFPRGARIDDIVFEYLVGWEFVQRLYANDTESAAFLRLWYYPYVRAPLLADIRRFLTTSPNLAVRIQRRIDSFERMDVPITPKAHVAFVMDTPAPGLDSGDTVTEDYFRRLRYDEGQGRLNIYTMLRCYKQRYFDKCDPYDNTARVVMDLHTTNPTPYEYFQAWAAAEESKRSSKKRTSSGRRASRSSGTRVSKSRRPVTLEPENPVPRFDNAPVAAAAATGTLATSGATGTLATSGATGTLAAAAATATAAENTEPAPTFGPGQSPAPGLPAFPELPSLLSAPAAPAPVPATTGGRRRRPAARKKAH